MNKNVAILNVFFNTAIIFTVIFLLLDTFGNLWVPILSFLVVCILLPGISMMILPNHLKNDGIGFHIGFNIFCWFFGILSYVFNWEVVKIIVWVLVTLSTITMPALIEYIMADTNKKCAWCGLKNIKFISGNRGEWFWKYQNKNGLRDKRRKNNVRKANYQSIFKCLDCSAKTEFSHIKATKPSQHIKIRKRTLLERGQGDRLEKNL